MKDRIISKQSGKVSRRAVLMSATVGITAMAFPAILRAQGAPTLVTSIRSLSNPYHAVWKTGSRGLCEGDWA